MAVRVEKNGGIAQVVLDRPERKNAMSDGDWACLARSLRELGQQDSVRAVVLSGAGGDFCAGADLVSGPEVRSSLERVRLGSEVARALQELPQPSIAKVRGVAVGAGSSVALGCDFVLASATARFAQIFVRRGLGLDAGAAWLLPRLVGLRRAKTLALLGDLLTAPEALDAGLINQVLPEAELDAAVGELAARLAAGPPVAMAAIKRTLHESIGPSLGSVLVLEEYSQSVNLDTEDFREAVTAFADRREPTFKGR